MRLAIIVTAIMLVLAWSARAQAPSGTQPAAYLPLLVQDANGPTVVQYRVAGAASRVIVEYIDELGYDKETEVGLPWSYAFLAAPGADLAVAAYSINQEQATLSCTITVNGQVVVSDTTSNSSNGVICERFVN